MSVSQVRQQATYKLDNLRRGTSNYGGELRALRQQLTNGGLTLADIGTSEEELEQLRVLGCKTVATNHLNNLRRGSSSLDYELRGLRQQLTNGGLTLADIGTSEEELESLLSLRS
jgi:hypothetical protein